MQKQHTRHLKIDDRIGRIVTLVIEMIPVVAPAQNIFSIYGLLQPKQSHGAAIFTLLRFKHIQTQHRNRMANKLSAIFRISFASFISFYSNLIETQQ
ncbi:MAG: hypothetical protein CL946_09880 [Ectothiorhodospiraceae bacterium]|nr:hypothetical protein [Ectothiorhodospiraceae bacterium]